MIRLSNNCNINHLYLCIFFLVFFYWTKPPHLKGAAGKECWLGSLCFHFVLCVSMCMSWNFPPSPPEPPWAFASLCKPSPLVRLITRRKRSKTWELNQGLPPVKWVAGQMARGYWTKPTSREGDFRFVPSS